MVGTKAIPIKERFWSKVEMIPESTCWHWVGSLMSSGYGRISIGNNKHVGAHRLSWEIHNGKIPDGLHVLHHCDLKTCVNISHLFLGTPKDNMQDMMQKGRSGHHKLRGRRKPYCVHGHIQNESTTYTISNGQRFCRMCARKRSLASFEKRRKYPKGHVCRGEETSACKLTSGQVLKIRKTYVKSSRKFGSAALAKAFGVDKSTILNIVYRKIWNHI